MASVDKLSRVLLALGLTDESQLDGFKYCGGDTAEHKNYFKLLYGDNEKPAHSETCVCGHKITENCYVTDSDGKMYVIGNCCIKQFLKKSGRTCEICAKPHKNRKDNLCAGCRSQKMPPRVNENHCEDCGELCGKFDRCYACNNNDPRENKCSVCGIDCGDYKKCYKCFNIGKPENKCSVCGINCKTFKTCWKHSKFSKPSI